MLKFRDLEVGEVCIVNGVAMEKIAPTVQGNQRKGRWTCNAKAPDGSLHYVEDNGSNIIESIEDH